MIIYYSSNKDDNEPPVIIFVITLVINSEIVNTSNLSFNSILFFLTNCITNYYFTNYITIL